MDIEARRIVDEEWCARFGRIRAMLRHGGVYVVAADRGSPNDAMSYGANDRARLHRTPES